MKMWLCCPYFPPLVSHYTILYPTQNNPSNEVFFLVFYGITHLCISTWPLHSPLPDLLLEARILVRRHQLPSLSTEGRRLEEDFFSASLMLLWYCFWDPHPSTPFFIMSRKLSLKSTTGTIAKKKWKIGTLTLWQKQGRINAKSRHG